MIKYCFIKSCKNNTCVTPDKRFFTVPSKTKSEWCAAAGLDRVPTRGLFICEDHLDLEEDLENFSYWKTMKGRAVLKPRLPVFRQLFQEVEEDWYIGKSGKVHLEKTANLLVTQTYDDNVRAKRKADEAVTGQTSSSPTLQHDVTPENSSDVEPLAGTYAANLVVLQGIPTVFSWCCFCRQVRDDCHELTHDKPYASTDIITLNVNDISVDVDLTKGTPRTVCQSCDAKLQEMYEFVKLVKEAQEKFTSVSNFDDLSGSPVNLNEIPSNMSTSDGEDVLYDPLSISETEFTNTKVSASKRKNNKEAAVPRKKFSVSIDFSSMSLSSFDDDSYGSNDIGSNCNQTFTSVDSSKASTREINKEVNITNSRHIAEIDTFNTANAQVTNNQQNTNTSFSDTLNIANVDIPVSVINKESGREVISTFRFSGCTLQIASEDVETLIVKEEYNELPNNIVDEDVHRHTITEMQLAESQNQPTIEITNTVTNKDSPKENTDEINVSSKVVSENAESVVIKEECIILSDDEDNNDIESTTNIKLEPTENTSVLYNLLRTSHLLDTNP